MFERYERYSKEGKLGSLAICAGIASSATGNICDWMSLNAPNLGLIQLDDRWSDGLEYGGFSSLTVGLGLAIHNWYRSNR
jgi:hypothetical protein